MNVEIKKAKITNSMFLYYEFKRTDVTSNDICKISSDAPMHNDLHKAFKSLIPCFALITEQIADETLVNSAIEEPENYLEDRETAIDDSFFKFRVHEVSIKGKDGFESYQIFGSRQLENYKEIHFSTPEFSLTDDDLKFKIELADLIKILKEEVIKYMEGKQAPKQQLEMFGNSDSEETEFENED
jgi:hypothetical protein